MYLYASFLFRAEVQYTGWVGYLLVSIHYSLLVSLESNTLDEKICIYILSGNRNAEISFLSLDKHNK
jgi:hypothetical protein